MNLLGLSIYEADVLKAIKDSATRSDLNEMLKELWENPGSWSRYRGPSRIPTISESGWKSIIETARIQFDLLPKDPFAQALWIPEPLRTTM